MAWFQKLINKKKLFHGIKDDIKIGILGSMFNAYLIVLEAHHAGIQVVFCLESSPARLGAGVWDVPIISIEDIRFRYADIDYLILSSEHDQENALKKIIVDLVPDTHDLSILSWKELAFK